MTESPTPDFRSIKPMSAVPLTELRTSEETHVAGHGPLLLIFGKRFYGPVDEVPEWFYVATSFWHLWFIPLVPRESWLLFHESAGGGGLQGIPIALSWKSVLVAWFRALCIVLSVFFGLTALARFFLVGQVGDLVWECLFLSGLLLGGFFLTGRLRGASPERALELAEQAQLPADQVKDLRERLERFQV
ncbi:MAG: hypothetical protein HY000_42285 [Planctomycetes bacterium]|nr:hypothetical protein [Planctomycetota bacterium]